MSHAISLPFKLANLIRDDESAIKIKGFELITSTTTSLLSDCTFIKLPLVVKIDVLAIKIPIMKLLQCLFLLMKFVIQNGNNAISSNTINQESDCSQSLVVSCSLEVNSVAADKLTTTDNNKSVVGDLQTTDESCFLESNSKSEIVGDVVVAVNNEVVEIDGTKQRKSTHAS